MILFILDNNKKNNSKVIMSIFFASSIVANQLKKKRKVIRKSNTNEDEEEYEVINKSINRADMLSIIKLQDYDKQSSLKTMIMNELEKYLLKIPEKQILMPGHIKHVLEVMEKILSPLDFQVFISMIEKVST